MQNKKMIIGVLLLTASALMFELFLVRIFSIIFFSNLAFLGISIALLGVALGGLVIYAFPNYFSKDNFFNRISTFCFLYAIILVLFNIYLVSLNAVQYGDNFTTIITSIELFTASTIPMCFANICLAYVFKTQEGKTGKLYFADLFGAGIGVIVAVLAMTFLTPVNVMILVSITAFLAAIFFNYKSNKIIFSSSILITLLLGLLIVNQRSNFLELNLVLSKLGVKKNDVIFQKWNSFSHISVTKNDSLGTASLPPAVRNSLGIRIDGDAYTPIYPFDGDWEKVSFLKSDLSDLAFQLHDAGSSLIIGPGGGRDVLMALLSHNNVTGVDINPIIVNDLMKKKFFEFSGGIYNNKMVNIKVAEGRSFIRADKNSYDVIAIPLVDTWASTIGGNLALVENYLYTVEAFNDFLNHLKPNGTLTITRWAPNGVRLLSLYLEASKNVGISNPEKNVLIISNSSTPSNYNLHNFLFKNSAFTQEEVAVISNFAKNNGFFVIYNPLSQGTNDYYEYLNANQRSLFIKNYKGNLSPTYDNRPFFFFNSLFLGAGSNASKVDGGLGTIFVVIFIFSVLIIGVPFFKGVSNKAFTTDMADLYRYIGYFCCLGFGFIFIEMGLIQKFILYLEYPIYSYSVILAALLVTAGAGSFVSSSIDNTKKNWFYLIAILIFALQIFSISLLQLFLHFSINFSIAYKILLAALLTAPSGFFMGMMLPLGLRRLQLLGRDHYIPLCWAANGAISVLASVVSMILAIYFGFNFILIVGGMSYLAAAFFIFILKEPSSIINSKRLETHA